jgi:hypothetical protein
MLAFLISSFAVLRITAWNDSSKLKEIQHYPVEKGGDPAAGSPTATLLRLSPNHGSRFRRRPPEG